MKTTLKGALLATAVAGLFLTKGALAEDAGKAAEAKKVKCLGVNECKGHGACAGAGNACSGQNGCKGQGFLELSAEECKAKGGKEG